MSAIEIKVTRQLHLAGAPRAAGETLSVDVLTASQLVASGRAVLCDPGDLALLLDAEREHTASACRDNALFRVPRAWATR